MKTLIGSLFIFTFGLMIFMNSCHESGLVYSINQDKCIACRACVSSCGFDAISFAEADSNSDYLYKVTIDPKKCVGCGECVLVCPADAITSASTRAGDDDEDDDEDYSTTTTTTTPTTSTTTTTTTTPGTTTTTTTPTTTTAKTYAVNSSRCTGCGHCRNSCSYGALTFSGGKAVINASKCTGCGNCVRSCPRSAIYQQ